MLACDWEAGRPVRLPLVVGNSELPPGIMLLGTGLVEVVEGARLPLVHVGFNQSRRLMIGGKAMIGPVLEGRQAGPGHKPGSTASDTLRSMRGGVRELDVVVDTGGLVIVLNGDAELTSPGRDDLDTIGVPVGTDIEGLEVTIDVDTDEKLSVERINDEGMGDAGKLDARFETNRVSEGISPAGVEITP